jgi:putative cardiolipin synthase
MRLELAATAERTLDAQYFIWHDDRAGTLLFDALRAAGDRGVRVRVLLDDANSLGLDGMLAALDAHPNVEVRVFNAFHQRGARFLGYLTEFGRLNRRMRNKSFTADNRATIAGGRNIGDEYFGSGDGELFGDFDILAVGPVATAVSRQFVDYRNSPAAYPVSGFARNAAALPQPLPEVADERRRQPETADFLAEIDTVRLARALAGDPALLRWVPASLVTDDAAKVTHPRPDRDSRILREMADKIGPAKARVDIISPYFVPGKRGTQDFVELAQRGIEVRVLTNSLAATNHAVVHAGFLKRRRALLRAGVRLFELQAEHPEYTSHQRGFAASSGAVLHAKMFAVDRRWLFVGSYNVDPRSAHLNSEMGLVLDDPGMAGAVADAFDRDFADVAWEVQARDDGSLQWLHRGGGGERVLRVEPRTGLAMRIGVRLVPLLPIDWLL